jgi:LytS/YehU family sensor histidine kinase
LAGISFLWHITDPVGPETWEKIKERREMVHPESPPENGSEREILRLDRNPAPSPGPPRPDNNSPGPHLFFGFVQMLGILFLSTLFWMVLESRRKEKEQLSLTNQNLETEMKFLKSQMNPHFLFNALNNIYSLSQQGSAKTPKLLLKLSSMLRFIVYETDEKKIPIGREIDYILDFIEFQKIKLEEKPNLEIDFNQIDREIRIEPMLIFPFFENAFKHGNIGDTKNGWIKAFLKAKDGHIVFFIANSKPAGHVSKDKSKGIGIENVKKRLSFLYKDRYRLNIVDKLDFFEVQMEIET